ncbi:Uu.00g016450.m01.CDS01 [Anthostomella pinea]|uniref:Uu.00g016450.m01.CDS01 n=1 Tax=Anthostomella pinea TaxID=933095 RepID=A0AAI8VSX5_9PEZI|nr:Uu.00g016450.m01.CDS01 [Anthostomella pinea]
MRHIRDDIKLIVVGALLPTSYREENEDCYSYNYTRIFSLLLYLTSATLAHNTIHYSIASLPSETTSESLLLNLSLASLASLLASPLALHSSNAHEIATLDVTLELDTMATEYSKLKVVDLKAELKRLGLPQNGLKAELVARLEEATTSDSAPPEPQEPVAAENTGAVSDDAQPSEAPEAPEVPEAAKAVEPTEPETELAPPQESEPTPAPIIAQDDPSTAPSQAQAAIVTSPSDATPLRPTEVVQDSQKRKRRSVSPPPSAEDVARKRPKQEDKEIEVVPGEGSAGVESNDPKPEITQEFQRIEAADTEMGDAESKEVAEPEKGEGGPQIGTVDVEMEEDAKNGRIAELEPDQNDKERVATAAAAAPTHNGFASADHALNDSEPGTHNGFTSADHALNDSESGAYDRSPTNKSMPREPTPNTYPADRERDVGPSIHPATSALYIKNFMRPLRPQAVKDHLLELATPADRPIDDTTITHFYLDTIRTHVFVVFNSISAASRVRTSLHERIWPLETTRKPLWVDFVPPERFDDWVHTEESPTDRRGSNNRYEVVYDDDREGNVTARLEECDSPPPATKQTPLPPATQSERKMSIPTGPSRFSGIENAPTGPRNRGVAVHPSGMERLDPSSLSTRAYPVISFQPVPEELARRRLAAIAAAKAPDHERQVGKDYKRYFFEGGDLLVDRGPEIFLDVRWPAELLVALLALLVLLAEVFAVVPDLCPHLTAFPEVAIDSDLPTPQFPHTMIDHDMEPTEEAADETTEAVAVTEMETGVYQEALGALGE